jgi:hypothetical protein
VKVTSARVRFVLKAAFLIVVAAICWAASLSWKGIVPAMVGAWVLMTLVERAANSGERRRREAAPAEQESEAEQPPTPIPEPGPEPGPAPEPVPPVPEPSPPRPEPTPLPDPNPQLEAVPDPEPEPIAAPLPQRDGAPREWNVWELERIARDIEGTDAGRDQELAFLLLELRQFANADGMLPPSFDPVIRETFGELLYAGI